MTREQMIQKLVSGFNRAHGTRAQYQAKSTSEIVNAAIEAGTEEAFWSREIIDFVSQPQFTELVPAFTAYIEMKKSSGTKPTTLVVDEIPAKQAVNDSLGLLERALVEVIVNNQGANIANQIIGSVSEKVDSYVRENYGTLKRKVEIEVNVGDVRSQFDERLHSKFETVLKFVTMNEPVFLTGAAGCGKNVICKQVAKALGIDFYFSNAVTQEYKITGFTDANGTFHETQFYKAFKNGGLFMLDEIDASIPEVLVILNAAIANRYFDFPAPIGYVEAHPDFRVIAAGNTFGLGADYQYVGRNQLDMASLDRFALIPIDYDREIEMSISDGDDELVSFADDFRNAAATSGVQCIVSYRAIQRMHKMLKIMDIEEVLRTCLLKNLQTDDINMVYNALTVNGKYKDAIKKIINK